jgi:hypothetical protein
MGDKTVSVRVRFEGGDQVRAGLQEVGRSGQQAMAQVEQSTNRMGSSLQNAGFQVSDFFVQVSAGTDPTRALAQQMPQLLQGFGLIGVAASVLVAALPSLWSLFGSGEEAAADLADQVKGLSEAMKALNEARSAAQASPASLFEDFGAQASQAREVLEIQRQIATARAENALAQVRGGLSGVEGLSDALAIGDDAVTSTNRLYALEAAAEAIGIELQEQTVPQLMAVAQAMQDLSTAEGPEAQAEAMGRLRSATIEAAEASGTISDATLEFLQNLTDAELAALGLASIDLASNIGAGADQASRLANELMRVSGLNYGRILNTGESGPDAARRSVLGLNAPGVATGTIASGAGGIYRPPPGSRGGGGGGGGADPDIARAKALTDSLRTSTEQYASALEEVNRLKEKGLITDDTYTRQLEKLNEKLGQTGDLGKQAASAIRGAFDNLFDDPQKALEDLSRQLAMMALYQGLARGFPSVFGSGGFLSLGVPGFAGGGMHRGGLRIVGENGPELEATGPAMIYPNETLRNLRGGGGGTMVVVNNNTGQPTNQKQSRGPDGRELVEITVGDSISNGRQDRSLQGRFGVKPQRTVR